MVLIHVGQAAARYANIHQQLSVYTEYWYSFSVQVHQTYNDLYALSWGGNPEFKNQKKVFHMRLV